MGKKDKFLQYGVASLVAIGLLINALVQWQSSKSTPAVQIIIPDDFDCFGIEDYDLMVTHYRAQEADRKTMERKERQFRQSIICHFYYQGQTIEKKGNEWWLRRDQNTKTIWRPAKEPRRIK